MNYDFYENDNYDNLFLVGDNYTEDAWSPLDFLPEIDPPKIRVSLPNFETPTPKSVGRFQSAVISGMEVGDDRVDTSFNPKYLELELTFQTSVLQMKTSVEDTLISKNVWNFCEVTGILPCAKEQSFDYARKSGTMRNLAFLDCPPLRIIMDTQKGDKSHSNSAVGKAQMLGSRVNNCRTEFRATLQLSSFLQDSHLNTARSPDPKYLPKAMGGSGSDSPFGDPANLYLFVMAYKSGTYERVYGTATNELKTCIQTMDKGKPAEPFFCNRLRDKQEYLHGTYAEKVFLLEEGPITSPFWDVPPPIYLASGTEVGISGVENRLIRAKRLMPKRQARAAVQQTDRLIQVIKGNISIAGLTVRLKLESATKRKEYGMALQSNSAFQRLLSRSANETDVNKLLSDKFFRAVTCGQRNFLMDHAIWLHHGAKGETYTIRDIRESEDMYITSDVSSEETFRVGGIPLSVLHHYNRVNVKTKARVGLYEISSTQEEWADNLLASLQAASVLKKPLNPHTVSTILSSSPEWVNDDSLLIGRAIRENAHQLSSVGCIILVTDDKKLARQMSRSTNMIVIRYTPSDIVERLSRLVWDSESAISYQEFTVIDPYLRNTYNFRDPKVYIDSGSLMSAAAKYTYVDKLSYTKLIVKRKLLSCGYKPHRTAQYLDQEIIRSELPPPGKQKYYPKVGKPSVPEYLQTRWEHHSSSRESDTTTINTRNVDGRQEM